MGWYRTGTVNVAANSATITGVGTAFLDNVKIGDEFAGPDGRSYEITNIATNTSLTVIPAYKGATATGQAYHIKPTQSWAREAALQLANYTGRIGGAIQKADGAVQRAEIATVKYETAAGMLLTSDKAYGLGKHGLGTVSDYIGDYPTGFYSIAGTALNGPPGVGGYQAAAEYTRINADRGVWSVVASGNTNATRKAFVGVIHGPTIAWREVFTSENLVGSVGEGAAMQSGSNASGHWLRLAEGTQFAWTSSAFTAPTDPALPLQIARTCPVAFLAGTYAKSVSFSVGDALAHKNYQFAEDRGSPSMDVIARVGCVGTQPARNGTLNIEWVGRWK